jgi:amino acid transporter
LGKFSGFQTGWFIICASGTGRAANFHVFVSYLAALFPVFDGPFARPATIVGAIAFVALLTVIGTRRSITALWVGTVLKLAPLIVLIVFGLGMNGVPTDVTLPTFTGLESVALLIAYAFSGFAASNIASGETTNPTSTIFRSIMLSIAGVAVFYAAIQWAYIAIGPDAWAGSDDAPLASAARVLLGEKGAVMISVAAILSIAVNQLSGFIAFPRVLFAMGERGLLPRFFAHVSRRFLTPDHAIISYGAFVAAIAVSGAFASLATLLVAIEQVIFVLLLTAFALLWKRNFRGMSEASAPLWSVIFAVASALTAWLCLQLPLGAVFPTAGMIAIGAVLYWLAKLRTSRELPS